MRRFSVSLTLLWLVVGLSLVPHALARIDAGGTYSVYHTHQAKPLVMGL